MRLQKAAYSFIIFFSLVIILIYGKDLLIPIVFAVFLWFIISEIRGYMDRVDFIQKKIPGWIKNLFVSFVIIGLLGLVSTIISANIQSLSVSMSEYEKNAEKFIAMINNQFDIDVLKMATEQLGNLDFAHILSVFFNAIADIVGNAFIILIYTVFIFLEESNFKVKLIAALNERKEKSSTIIHSVEKSVRKYLGLKTLLSLITGTLSYIVLLLIGVDAPAFWAFLIFLLNFIPTIGSLVATIFPAIFSVFQFGEVLPAVMVVLFVGSVQVLVGNFLEPRMMGNSLNVSSLVALISLSIWGAVWGVTGMILSVPITVMMVIVFAQFQSTKPIAIMLSEKGEV